MKPRIKHILLFAAVLLQTQAQIQAQIEEKWTTQLESSIDWMEVTSLGNFIIGTQGGLASVDSESGKTNWNLEELKGLQRTMYSELSSSPFFSIDDGNDLFLIDQFSGDVVFNSSKAGIETIDDYFLLYDSDAILVVGSDASKEPLMLSVKMSDGSLSWTKKEEFGRIVAVNELDNSELLIVTLFNNYLLNANTGKEVWKESTSKEAAQLESMGALGSLMKTMAENATENMDIDLRYYQHPTEKVFYLGFQEERKSSSTNSSGEPIITYKNNYTGYRMKDGSMVWNDKLEVKGKIGQVAPLENGLLVMPNGGNRTKINLFDYASKEGKWGKKGKGIAIKGGVYDYLNTGEGILLVTQTSSKNFLNYLDSKAGAITFDKPVKVDGNVVGIVPLTKSILYITTESMNILDPVSGELKWKKSIKTRPELTVESNGKIYAFDTKSGTIKVVQLDSESLTDLTTEELKFEGRESPTGIEILEDGIFLHSDQNVAKFDFTGKKVFQEYYPAPRESGWKQALMYASAIRATYIGATSYMMAGALTATGNEIKQNDALTGEVVSQVGNVYGELGNTAVSYAVDAFSRASARKKATQAGRDFIFIMSKEDKQILLLKVSKKTGKVEGNVALGKDREPSYAVDDITGQIFYQTSVTQIKSFQAK